MPANNSKKTVKRKTKKVPGKKLQRGTVGNFFVFGVLALLLILGLTAVGGLPSQTAPTQGQLVNIITPTPGINYSNLQLKSFGYVTIAPTPTPAKSSLCNDQSVNTEPSILAAYSPGIGQTVSTTGQVKVWVNDEGPPYIAPGETVDPSTGKITTPGDTNAKAPDGYLWEPSLYIGTPVEQGGTPHFPDYIKGDFNNLSQPVQGAPIDPVPQGAALLERYTAEDIWDVSKLGLAAGTYQAEFVIHDGDFDRGIGCVSITIQ